MKNKTIYILIFLAVLILSSGISLFLFSHIFLVDVKTIPYNFSFSRENVLGINANNSYLGFGKIPIDGSSTRYIVISCKDRCFVSIKIHGSGKQFIEVDKNNFWMFPNQTVNLSFTVTAPHNAIIGRNYNGNISILFFRFS